MGWFAAAIAVLALLVLYVAWTARRLDRLHVRVDGAAAALEAQLRARAEAADVLAASGDLATAEATAIGTAAAAVRAASGLGHDRENAENLLSRALRDHLPAQPAGDAGRALVDAATRATFARRFYNDAVRDAEVVRQRRVVRWLHLAGHAPPPAYFEIDEQAGTAPAQLPTPPVAG